MSKARELAELSRTVSDSADAVAITIDSTEKVSFANGIDVTGGITATGDLTLSSAGPGITLTDTDNNPDYQIKNGNGSFRIIDTTNSEDRININTSGNVGIGTSSISAKLHVLGSPQATSGALAFLRNSDATSSNTSFGGIHFSSSPGTDFSIGKSNVNAATSLSFRNGNTGAVLMDLNASGNLLIGVTSTTIPGVGNTTAGVSIRGDDGSFFSRSLGSGDTNNVVSINRTTAVGSILGFASNGTQVGGIGTRTVTELYLDLGSSGLTGSSTGGGAILPTSGGTNYADAAVDLGFNSGRFRNLYLSGGAYLGGTGSANYLDDYEQGSWSLTTTALSGVSVLTAQYTKIGQLVVADIRVTWTGSTNDGSAVSFSLPFVSQNPGNSTSRTGIVFYQGSSIFGGNAISAHISQGASNVSFYNTGGGTFRSLLASDVNGSYNWLVTVSYFTDL